MLGPGTRSQEPGARSKEQGARSKEQEQEARIDKGERQRNHDRICEGKTGWRNQVFTFVQNVGFLERNFEWQFEV